MKRWTVLTVIFLLAFVPRAVYPISRSSLWYQRAIYFGDALLARNWEGTYQRYHPGVTAMWLSGIALKLFAWQRGLSSEQLLGLEPTKPGVVRDATAAGVMPLAFVIALCIALAYVLLNRIANQRVAFAASVLWALDPFHITYSKELHLNALLATFMFISVLFLYSYLHRSKGIDLVLSGVFAGLSWLTKSPALFLVPYAILTVGVYRLVAGVCAGIRGRRRWVRELGIIARTLLVWGVVAAVIFVVVWPAMWTRPHIVLRRLAENVLRHVETPKHTPVFFRGEVTLEDPGILFYLAAIAWKMTAVTMPLVCIALVLTPLLFRHNRGALVVGLLGLYVVFFTLQMGLGRYKQVSYMVPVFPVLDVIAAFGLVWSAEAIGHARWWQGRCWLPTVCMILPLAIQAGIVLPRHPYYGTHHNILLGGSKVAQHILPLQDVGEGIDLAAQYLSTLPRAERGRAVVHYLKVDLFARHFVGLTSVSDPWATYRVYDVNQVMRRNFTEEEETAWQIDRQSTPLWTKAFDGITYVWVYGAPPGEPASGGPEYEMDCKLGEHIELRRVRISSNTLAPGDTLMVVPIWESDGEIGGDYMVFCHLLSVDGKLAGQRDSMPVYGVRPTSTWRAGEIIEDSYEVFLGDDLPPGVYELSVGMYDIETMKRLPAYDATGERLPEDRVVVGSIYVEAGD